MESFEGVELFLEFEDTLEPMASVCFIMVFGTEIQPPEVLFLLTATQAHRFMKQPAFVTVSDILSLLFCSCPKNLRDYNYFLSNDVIPAFTLLCKKMKFQF